MIYINFTEPINDEDWSDWRDECQEETSRIIAKALNRDFESITIKNLYKKENIKKKYYLNDNFKEPFWRKCAYCEESIGSQNGDIEHFRPKKRVTDDNFNPIENHNGYYWLAYDWKNLLPSCTKCNQRRIWEKEEGIFIIGKQDRFPIELNTNRVFDHNENIENEKPLLINPLKEDPENHLKIQLKSGIMLFKSPRGEKSIEIFGLNIRDDIREGRKGVIEQIRSLLDKFFCYAEDEDNQKAVDTLEKILKHVYGQKRFSLAARCFLKQVVGEDYKERLEERLAHFKDLL